MWQESAAVATPVIIEAAINGLTTRDRSPHVPRSPGEIAADGLRCLAAGAAIVHSHNAEMAVPAARAADLYLAAWRPLLGARPDAIVYPTVGAGATIVEKYAHIPLLVEAGVLRMGLVDPGSVNLGPIVYANSADDIEHEMGLCARHRLGPSLAVYEPGFLRATLAFHAARRLPPGALVKLYFGGEHDYFGRPGPTFGLPPTRASLEAYLAMLEGTGLPWSVAVMGGDVVRSGLARLALERGGHLHVGLEDYSGPRTPTNEDLVREAVQVAGDVGRPIATPSDAARLLDLPRAA